MHAKSTSEQFIRCNFQLLTGVDDVVEDLRVGGRWSVGGAASVLVLVLAHSVLCQRAERLVADLLRSDPRGEGAGVW